MLSVSIILFLSPSLFALDFICSEKELRDSNVKLNSNYVFVRNAKPSVIVGLEKKLQVRVHIPSEKIMHAQFDCIKNGKVGEFEKRNPVSVVSPVYFCESKVSYLPTLTLELGYVSSSENIGADIAMLKLMPHGKIELACKDL